MQITLKQREIEAALTAYIIDQGINLAGKSVEIAFTAGRKEAGIIAEIDIEEKDFAVAMYSGRSLPLVEAPRSVDEVLAEPECPVPDEPVGAEPGDVPEPEPVVASKATSLFG